MFTKCKCLECEKPLNVIFDFRYVQEEKIELYAIEDDGRDPKPSGFCGECLMYRVGKDLDLIASKFDNQKVSFIDFRQRKAQRHLRAAGTS